MLKKFHWKACLFALFVPCFFGVAECRGAVDAAGEADFHYRSALDNFKSGNLGESVRILNENIFFYNPDNFDSYKLLIKIYTKTKQKEKAQKIERLLKKAQADERTRAGIKQKELAPLDAIRIGLPRQKTQACEALSKTRETAAIPFLIQALADHCYDFYLHKYPVREAALACLKKYGEPAVAPLISAAASKDLDLRWWALGTLSEMDLKNSSKIKNVRELFLGALQDSSVDSKIIAIQWAEKNKESGSIDRLILLKSDKNPGVRYNVAKALGGLCEPGTEKCVSAGQSLLGLLDDVDEDVQHQAIKSLTVLGKKRETVSALREIASDEKRQTLTRWYAIKGLGQVLSSEDKGELEQYLNDKDFWIRSAAAVALGKTIHKEELKTGVSSDQQLILDETALKLSLGNNSVIFEEARAQGIDKALKYLGSIQEKDGSFPSFFRLCTTELAVLCFQRQGYSKDDPVIKKAKEYILANRKADGSFYSEAEPQGKEKAAYTTALAIKLFSALKETQNADLVNASIAWVTGIQNPDGGFGYGKASRSDITATSFCLSSLNEGYGFLACGTGGEVFSKALGYLNKLQNPDGGFGYSEEERSPSRGTPTASGLIALLYTRAGKGDIGRAISWLSRNYTWDEDSGGANPGNYQYYVKELAEALNLSGQKTVKDKAGAEHSWYDDVLRKLLKEQSANGFWMNYKEPLFTTYLLGVLQLKKADLQIEPI
jgi:HEAT repeat protein/prenyltransferase beta subunit